MPARRRVTGLSESDDNFTIVIDNNQEHQKENQQQVEQQQDNLQFDEKEKYPVRSKWNFNNITNFIQTATQYTQSQLQHIAIPSFPLYDNSQQSNQQQQFISAPVTTQSQSVFQESQQQRQFQQQIEDTTDKFDEFLFDRDEQLTVMTAKDRTLEFSNAVRTMQGRNIARAVNIKDPRKATQLQSYAEFMMIAKHIGKNIASTYTKLEKLTLLAKRKSLFDDRPMEIQELTYIIKGDLNSLNQQIARLQEVSKSQRKTTNGKHLLSHSSNMVLALQAKLANMSTDFKQILEVRTENLKQQKTRRDQFSQSPIATNLPPSAMRGSHQGSLLLSEQEQQKIPLLASNQQPSNLTKQQYYQQHQQHQQQQQQQQQQPSTQISMQTQQMIMYDESEQYVQQRAETMQNIESTIVELGGIFQQLAHMVKEQEEMVERIDTNVQDAELNIEAAHSEILRYFQSVTKNRWLMIKIFGVLIVFFIFFVMFLA